MWPNKTDLNGRHSRPGDSEGTVMGTRSGFPSAPSSANASPPQRHRGALEHASQATKVLVPCSGTERVRHLQRTPHCRQIGTTALYSPLFSANSFVTPFPTERPAPHAAATTPSAVVRSVGHDAPGGLKARVFPDARQDDQDGPNTFHSIAPAWSTFSQQRRSTHQCEDQYSQRRFV
jgi:hypothetical protein